MSKDAMRHRLHTRALRSCRRLTEKPDQRDLRAQPLFGGRLRLALR